MEIGKKNFEEGFQDLEEANREEMVMSRYNLLYNILMIKSVLVLRNLRAKWGNSLPEYGRDVDPFSHWSTTERIFSSVLPRMLGLKHGSVYLCKNIALKLFLKFLFCTQCYLTAVTISRVKIAVHLFSNWTICSWQTSKQLKAFSNIPFFSTWLTKIIIYHVKWKFWESFIL